MKLVIKNLASDVFLGVIRLALEVSDSENSMDYNFFIPVSNSEKPSPAALEAWVFDKQAEAETLFRDRFSGRTNPRLDPNPVMVAASGAVPVIPPVTTQARVAPPSAAAKLPEAKLPDMTPKAATPITGPRGLPPPPKPTSLPNIPPPVPAVQKPTGILYNRNNPQHANIVRNITIEVYGKDWKSVPQIGPRIQLLLSLIDQKKVIYDADGVTINEGFRSDIIQYLNGEAKTV